MGKTPLAAPAVSKQSKPYLYCLFFVVSLSGFVCPAGPFIPPTLWATVVAELRTNHRLPPVMPYPHSSRTPTDFLRVPKRFLRIPKDS